MIKIYAGELGQTKVRANLVDPGIVATKLRTQGFPGEDQARLAAPDDVTEPFVAAATAECRENGEIFRP
jgi:NAD(P)-dependent dehydrogenase (short-subunit alcohol dehydrogenase family)